MSPVLNILLITFPFFALVLAGYLAAKRGMLPLEAIPGLNGFVLFFALPAMLYRFGSTTPIADLLVPAVAEDLSKTSKVSPLGVLTLTTRVAEGGTHDTRYWVSRTENGRLALGEATVGKRSVLGDEESKQLLGLLGRDLPLK